MVFTTIEIMYADRKKVIENVAIDTAATCTLISPDSVADIGLEYELVDQLGIDYGIGGHRHAFKKQVDWIRCGPFCVGPLNLGFGNIDPNGNINGLLGLDLLLEAGAVIDLKNLLLYEGT